MNESTVYGTTGRPVEDGERKEVRCCRNALSVYGVEDKTEERALHLPLVCYLYPTQPSDKPVWWIERWFRVHAGYTEYVVTQHNRVIAWRLLHNLQSLYPGWCMSITNAIAHWFTYTGALEILRLFVYLHVCTELYRTSQGPEIPFAPCKYLWNGLSSCTCMKDTALIMRSGLTMWLTTTDSIAPERAKFDLIVD